MLPSIHNPKRLYYFLICMLLFSTSALVFSRSQSVRGVSERRKELSSAEGEKSTSPQVEAKFDPLKYLPLGATIPNSEKNVVFADLDGDGTQEVIIFYTVVSGTKGQADILVLKSIGGVYERFWENSYEGSSGFFDPTGVHDVNKSGPPQIVAYRIVGASCPGVLDIFQYANGAIEKITGDWIGSCQSDLEIKDLDGDGISEIIFRPLKYGANRRIYSWNGKQYIRTDEQHARYFNDELRQLVGWIHESRPLPTPARTSLCEQAVRIYLLQRRYHEAIELCKAVLPMIDDPELTVPNSGATTPEQQNRIAAHFEADKIKDKARIYSLIADAFKASGDLRSAKKHYAVAKKLESEAVDKNSRLPF